MSRANPLRLAGRFTLLVLLASLAVATSAQTAPPRSAEHFAHGPMFSRMRISPDGTHVAYVQDTEGTTRIMVRELGSTEVLPINLPNLFYGNLFGGVQQLTWASSRRVLLANETGLWGVDRDGKDYRPLSGNARKLEMGGDNEFIWLGHVLHRYGGRGDEILIAERDPYENPNNTGWMTSFLPNVLRLNTRNGKYRRVEANPGDILAWYPAADGTIPLALQKHGDHARPVHRAKPGAPWVPLAGLEPFTVTDSVTLLGLDETGQTAYLAAPNPAGRRAIYAYDLTAQRLGEEIASHDYYDIVAAGPIVGSPDIPLQGLIRDAQDRLLGFRYVTEFPRTVWLDPEFAQIQAAIDQALPGRINTLVDLSEDSANLLFLSWSARHPGTYYRFDRRTMALAKLVDTMPWIDPDEMAEMRPIRITARDGTPLHGYVTLPRGRESERLPMVVMPHGGLWARDTYRFDPLVQFLAHRGYAVLLVNFRGSVGYGQAFATAGEGQFGDAVQTDIADATAWAIAEAIADPDRIAIGGGSFGGYSALMGVIRHPELYRCAVSIAGVTDWNSLFSGNAKLNPWGSARSRQRLLGARTDGAAFLDSISPLQLVDQIDRPLLLVHGRDDPVVSHDQADQLANALTRAGKPVERLSRFNEPHGILNYKNRQAMYERIEAFLSRELAPRPSS